MATPAGSSGAAATGERLLAIDGLQVTFGSTAVVDDVGFGIDRGRTVGLVGESGSGKSMTSLAIMGLLPPGAAVTGSIRLHDRELIGLTDGELRGLRGEVMAMVFQDPLSSLNPYYTVGLQIAEAYLAHRGGSMAAARKIAMEAMERVHIADAEHRIDHYPHQFSGGMRQRIMIAMALCCEPELIIADEPTTALDVTVQAQILQLLTDLQRDTGAGMLFITHDLAVISGIADDIVVMKDGRQVESGTAEQIFTVPQTDYTRMLLAATPRIDDDFPELPAPRTGADRR
ncbi:ABC transporter ATP-binding protein [Microlunatus soli]|uniref:Peptide/nickel transport system ATP-binding protein n=1 Tax=Microlunatus soli TaxID=630515 RepID=A0A1H1SHN5_9ACTN|nr:ABC transporter ATP-binding protein [Microlunatus soli]SDS47495.1 peptide/nickel transport system ATP-binding protein [Microlunatus soli]